MSTDRIPHALSFDVEEFFQVANFTEHFPRASWDDQASRIDIGMKVCFDLLERHQAKATFFFLGWVAERRPDLVQRCLAGGHEVQSHGYEHSFLADLGPEGLESDLERTEQALVAAGAPRPTGFRASTFTLTRETDFAFEILARRGYRYDSSVHPISHPTYGIADFEPGISRVETASGPLIEYPVSTLRAFGRNWPVGGGGYFRLLPSSATEKAWARLEKTGRPGCLYLHPWEFDPDQPRVNAGRFARFRRYLNLDRTALRLERLLERYRFVSLGEVLSERGWLEPQTA